MRCAVIGLGWAAESFHLPALQGTPGAELPPALLSRHDRQVLKSGFRSILRLLEFTADRSWLGHL